jgi:Mg2+/citrate symporter
MEVDQLETFWHLFSDYFVYVVEKNYIIYVFVVIFFSFSIMQQAGLFGPCVSLYIIQA